MGSNKMGFAWSDLFAKKKEATPDAAMGFDNPPDIDGKRVADVAFDDVSENLKHCEDMLIGVCVGKKLPYWLLGMLFKELGKLKDRLSALEYGTLFISNQPFFGHPWHALIEQEIAELKIVPIWVNLRKVPLHMWNAKALSKIASLIGTPIMMYKLTLSRAMMSYARILIEVDLKCEFPTLLHVYYEGKHVIDVEAEYSWKPPSCIECDSFGHVTPRCPWGKPKSKHVEVDRLVNEKVDKHVWVVKGTNKAINHMNVEVDMARSAMDEDVVSPGGNKENICMVEVIHSDVATGNMFDVLIEQEEVNKLSIIGIVETHVQVQNKDSIRFLINKNWCFTDNYANNSSDRIWIGWNPLEINVSVLHSASQAIFLEVTTSRNLKFVVTFVYGDNDSNIRTSLWNNLCDFASNLDIPWVVLGDFNEILISNERIGTRSCSPSSMNDFVQSDFLPPGISHHSSMVVSVFEERQHGPPPFRFYNYLNDEPDFMDIVRNVWSQQVKGNTIYVLVTKLKKFKQRLVELRRRRFPYLSESVVEAKKVMVCAQTDVQLRPLDPVISSAEKRLLETILELLGMKNLCSNKSIEFNGWNWGNILDEDKDIALECTSYFSSLFNGAALNDFYDNDSSFIQFSNFVSADDAACLSAPVSRDEIVHALSCIGSSKAPGPDGFSSHFFKVCWSIIEADFIRAIQNLFLRTKMLGEVHLCISSAKFSVLINGSPYGYFSSSRGLRQGCPLSPYLFVIVMEILSASLKNQVITGNFGLHPRCRLTQLTHLCFADDVLVFFKENVAAASSLKTALLGLSKISGLEMNKQKTALYSSYVDLSILSQIFQCLDCSTGELPFLYLGVPLLSTRLSHQDCFPLVSRVLKRVKSWKSKRLSYAGRLLLIKVVLSSMIYFWLSCFILPMRTVKELNSIFKRFLWAGAEMGKKYHPIRWDVVCRPFSEGGLGVRSIKITNEAANLRHLWDLVSRNHTIWTDWIHKNLIKNRDFWTFNIPQDASWYWRRILDQRTKAKDLILHIIGDGENTKFLTDLWHPLGRLLAWVSRDVLEDLCSNTDCKVGDFADEEGISLILWMRI
ncbi:uncharacterized protein LOC113331590 [Papaver somniferum]|uniref:uncharacterized protein LOC113331590 n=1 Tax=Papaver somniferum TaxID=3469 RepID=UPI000E700B08|nr:uncharacterized protein LOC113331590 [Papaver somniferum]